MDIRSVSIQFLRANSPLLQSETSLHRSPLQFTAVLGRVDESTVNVVGRNRHHDMSFFDLVKPILQLVMDRPISDIKFRPVF